MSALTGTFRTLGALGSGAAAPGISVMLSGAAKLDSGLAIGDYHSSVKRDMVYLVATGVLFFPGR